MANLQIDSPTASGSDFTVFVPGAFEIFEKSEGNAGDVRKIGGWCSTEDLDRQGEVVVAKGLDFSEFVNHGWFNDNHKQDTDAALGFPISARLEKGRWWTEGYLFPDYPMADRVWQIAKNLQKMEAPRRLGFSIEGKVVERDNHNKILRAKIRDVAITRVPVNTSCSWQALINKSFAEPSAIEDASARAVEKALQASTGSPALSSAAVLRVGDLEQRGPFSDGDYALFATALDEVRRRWPHLSRKTACRVARHAIRS